MGGLQGNLTPSPSGHPAVGTHLLPLLWVGLAAAGQPCVRHEGVLTGGLAILMWEASADMTFLDQESAVP